MTLLPWSGHCGPVFQPGQAVSSFVLLVFCPNCYLCQEFMFGLFSKILELSLQISMNWTDEKCMRFLNGQRF